MGDNLVQLTLVLASSLLFTALSTACFVLGVRYGLRQAEKTKQEVKLIEVAKPFVVQKEIVREVTTPGFIYPKPGTPNDRQEAEDRKMQEIITEPEL